MKGKLEDLKDLKIELESSLEEGLDIINKKRKISLNKLSNLGFVKPILLGFGMIGLSFVYVGYKNDNMQSLINGGAFLFVDSVYASGYYLVPYIKKKLKKN